MCEHIHTHPLLLAAVFLGTVSQIWFVAITVWIQFHYLIFSLHKFLCHKFWLIYDTGMPCLYISPSKTTFKSYQKYFSHFLKFIVEIKCYHTLKCRRKVNMKAKRRFRYNYYSNDYVILIFSTFPSTPMAMHEQKQRNMERTQIENDQLVGAKIKLFLIYSIKRLLGDIILCNRTLEFKSKAGGQNETKSYWTFTMFQAKD